MANAIEEITLRGGKKLTVGHFGLGMSGAAAGSVKDRVHDGDTINVRALGNFGVRLLGVDSAEISFGLPGVNQPFVHLSDSRWKTFLTDPFTGQAGIEYKQQLSPALLNHLQASLGPETADNHLRYARAAETELEMLISNDLAELGQTKDNFKFFLAFAFETTDRFGRLLAYINRDQPAPPRPADYNSRLLNSGLISPYFIWPNINPFRKENSLREAVPRPFTANNLADSDDKLRQARDAVRAAREAELGLFDRQDPLRLQPFELRFLADRRLPERWVIDLSKNDDRLIPPQQYHTVPNIEDRLFIPSDYLPLFVEAGWKKP
jgi:endonuclease YncB( thermonuclease family)